MLFRSRTQEEIASILGITTKTLDNWENGRTEMRLKSFVDICNLYQVSTDYIYGLSNDRQIKRKQKHEWQAKQID